MGVDVWITTFNWMFFHRGAGTLMEHPGLPNLPINSLWAVKVYFLIGLAGGVVGRSSFIKRSSRKR